MLRFAGFGFLFLLLLSAAPAWCGSDDCANGPAGILIQQSAFAHGYLHGYEAGFHAGDADFHSAHVRSPRELRDIDRPSGYEAGFGSRDSFRGGFREGFRVGYQDNITGRGFRAFENLVALAPAPRAQPREFDRGFEDGYKAGQRLGAGDLEADGDFDPGKGSCPAKADGNGNLPASSQAYCAGYLPAHRLGYTDGYLLASPGGGAAVVAAK